MRRTPLEFKTSCDKTKEQTSSHGQLHFCHFKAGVRNNAILMAHYVLAELLFQMAYSMKRWKSTTSIMLLKSSGVYNVEELDSSVLYSANLNHRCIFWERTNEPYCFKRKNCK